MSKAKRIAVIGAGVSGLTAARILATTHDVVVYEASSRIGGHAMTVNLVDSDGTEQRVDAGVCMFYTSAYPVFMRLLQKLDIPTERSDTSFELLMTQSGKRFHFDLNRPWLSLLQSLTDSEQRWLLRDGLKLYSDMLRVRGNARLTLGEYLSGSRFSEPFRLYLSFLCGATWTLNQSGVNELPLTFVLKTARQLGFIPTVRHGSWHHVPGSVGRYLDALCNPIKHSLRLNQAVDRIERVSATGVRVCCDHDTAEYDQVVIALPPAKALQLIANPTELEEEILGTFQTQEHTVLFTSDEPLIRSWAPNATTLFAASNVGSPSEELGREFLFQVGFADIRRMCKLNTREPFYMWYQFPDSPVPQQVRASIHFSTPRFTHLILSAQQRHREISGQDRLHFCGSSWGNGIHEGAVRSALAVTKSFQLSLESL